MAVVDTWSLLLATAEALRDTQHYAKLFEPTVELIQIVRLESNSDVHRDRALDATNHLRHYLAGLLPLD